MPNTAAQFLLNLFIALLLTFFKDQTEFVPETFYAGFLIGLVIVFIMRRFFGGRFYLHRLYSIIKLILIFISETFQSAVLVIKQILSPKIDIQPGIFRYETSLKGDWEVTTISLLLTRSEEHTSELQSRGHLVCRLLLEKKKK